MICQKWNAQNAARSTMILTGLHFPIVVFVAIALTSTVLLLMAMKYVVQAVRK
jgi:hypothetical protein